jgi:hypothetical protein
MVHYSSIQIFEQLVELFIWTDIFILTYSIFQTFEPTCRHRRANHRGTHATLFTYTSTTHTTHIISKHTPREEGRGRREDQGGGGRAGWGTVRSRDISEYSAQEWDTRRIGLRNRCKMLIGLVLGLVGLDLGPRSNLSTSGYLIPGPYSTKLPKTSFKQVRKLDVWNAWRATSQIFQTFRHIWGSDFEYLNTWRATSSA